MNYVCEKAYAKINLYLDIVSKREDGYHDIISVMQNITLCDTIQITKRSGTNILITCNNSELAKIPERNSAYRAAEEFLCNLGEKAEVEIKIKKNIPVAAGMAGGSADAAAVLRGLNRLFCNPFDTQKLCLIGEKIGADVPFCVVGGTKIAQGIGEVLKPCKGIPKCYIVSACGNKSSVSTPEAYKLLDKAFDNFEAYESGKCLPQLLQSLEMSDLDLSEKYMFNIFEPIISSENQSVLIIKDTMKKNGAEFAMMTGSGPSVFGIFKESKNAYDAVSELRKIDIFAEVCEPMVENNIVLH